MTARVVLLVTSPRLPAGLMTAAAWDLVRAHPVFAGAESAQTAAIGGVTVVAEGAVDALLAAADEHGTAVWLAGPTGDESLARELGLRLARQPGRAELELVYGSWDPPGARLLDAVTVMDRLLSPGGDPWKRQQTHATLAQFLLEECYEAYDAIEAGDLAALREELGDVLLQVVLHARLAENLPDGERWTVDDVAGDLVAKLIRRNPHVFADNGATTLEEITENWERIKRAEKSRESAMDGIALAQPALALAAKVLQRAERAGVTAPVPPEPPTVETEDELGAALLAAVAAARTRGLDAEAALRRAVLAHAAKVREAETPR
ncbi:nucleoside triphosphate pyrophosphohydrolase [Actinomycetes bacterium KLBMP 9797]